MKFSGEKVVEIYEKIQQKRPIIHCITNAVTVNDCANILLAAGAVTLGIFWIMAPKKPKKRNRRQWPKMNWDV